MFEWKQLFSFQYSFFALLTLLIHLRHKLFIINNKTLMRTLTDNALAVRSTHLKGQLASVNRSQLSGSGNTVAHSGSAVVRNIQADAYSAAALLQMSVDCGAGDLDKGVNDLAGASGKILDAISQFKSGTETLAEKTGDLNDGMGEFKDEGVDKLSDSDIAADIKKTLDIKDAMKEQADDIATYSG